ncbi:MAG TPA: CPBP family intramembrane glutamic endopeptidase [Xanthobacteraceae bacterium]|nr:CPBP family intramembrane glutamic endopeptidase [Xanthobacteraceae bacterium]
MRPNAVDARAPAFGYGPPWGYLATLGWIVLAFFIGAGAAYVGYVLLYGGDIQRAMTGGYDGVLVALSTLIAAPIQIAVIVLAVYIRRWPLARYLGLTLPTKREAIAALGILVALTVLLELSLLVFGQDPVPPFQREIYPSAKEAGWLPALLVAIVLFGPTAEEIIFRGFMYRGFVREPGHEPFAILFLTLAFTALHAVQYDWVGLLQVFILGLFLGWVRWATGSTLLTILLHMLVNLEAMIVTALRVDWR